MNMKRTFLALCVFSLLCSCQRDLSRLPAVSLTPFEALDERFPVDVPRPPYTVGPGDILSIIADPASGQQPQLCQVGVDGCIRVEPAPHDLVLAGLTLQEARDRLCVHLAKFIRNPEPEIRLEQALSSEVIVLGQVGKPGSVSLTGGERILDLLARTGGLAHSRFTDKIENLADVRNAIYARGQELLPIDVDALLKGDPRFNITVHPGDYFYIPSALDRFVYVLGAVESPDLITLSSRRTTLAQIVAKAGGFTRDAYIDRLLLLRGTRAKPIAARVNLQAILQGRAPDIEMESGDIIYLPGRTSANPRFWVDDFNKSFLAAITTGFANDTYNRLKK